MQNAASCFFNQIESLPFKRWHLKYATSNFQSCIGDVNLEIVVGYALLPMYKYFVYVLNLMFKASGVVFYETWCSILFACMAALMGIFGRAGVE